MIKKKTGLLIGIICALVLGIPYFLGWLEMLEYQGLDLLFRARGPRPVSQDIVVIEIDDNALKHFGRWPWPRAYHAEFLDLIREYGPKTVVFDIVFSEPNENAPGEDQEFAAQSKKSGNIFFSAFFDTDADKLKKNAFRPGNITLPLEILQESAKGTGFVNIAVEPDGKVRKVPIALKYEGKEYYSLDLLAAADFLGKRPAGLAIPTDANGAMWINFSGEFDKFNRISFSAVAVSAVREETGEKPLVDLNMLRGKIVIVGLTATGTEDFWSTSMASLYPGVGIRASAMNTILKRDFIHRINRPEVLLIMIILGLSMGLVLPKRNPLEGVTYFISLAAGVTAIAMVLFGAFNIWLDYATILVILCVSYPAITLDQFIMTRFEKGLIEKELQIASRIQQSILPQSLPQVEGIEIGVKCVPAKHVGGDFYDFIKLIYDFVKLKENRLGVVIGDVSGKGVPAALFMAKAMADFRGLSHDYNEPDETMTAINDKLVEEGVSGMFVTLQYLIYKPKERMVKYSNGGHNPLIWVKSGDGAVSLTQAVGSPIGIIPGSEFMADEFPVSAGDVFVMYTDGISEARDKNHKEFEEKRILDLALEKRGLSAQGLADKLVEEVVRFSEGMPQHDDMTVIVLKIV